MMEERSHGAVQFNQALSLVLYSLVSVSLVFLNKQMFIGDFSYPLFTTWVQQVCGLVCYLIAYEISNRILGEYRLISRPTIQYNKVKDCLPMSISCTVFILLSNQCLKYVPMASYSIARSLTLFFNIIFSIVYLKQNISQVGIIGCIIVTMGFIIGSFDASSLSIHGIFTGALSSFFQSVYTVQIKSVSKVLDDEFLVYWYNVLITSFLAAVPVLIFGEHEAFIILFNSDILEFTIKFGPILVTGILNFFLGIIIIWCIHTTSPIAYNLTGYVKSGIQTFIGVILNHDPLQLTTVLGLALTIGGSAIYSFGNFIQSSLSKSSHSNQCNTRLDHIYCPKDDYDSDSTKSSAPSLEFIYSKEFQVCESSINNETQLFAK
ncbi:nucleotide sugar transporter like integral membrane protein [Cryptosporidium canis]|uniref:Nucleotide sugar transporter like integral membrane protein n=1 Tax=Cryptosporidium canis TaxID=195482 RepID=A0A9D5DJD4_9CRYT|nr:nucleotide sugar transporter like integral membrane protein [Cryptosporidium canis]